MLEHLDGALLAFANEPGNLNGGFEVKLIDGLKTHLLDAPEERQRALY